MDTKEHELILRSVGELVAVRKHDEPSA